MATLSSKINPDTGSFATAAQGTLADTSLQPSDLGVTVQEHSITLDNTTAAFTTADETKLDGIEAGATADQTAAEILTAIKTVDGSGSGLDADLLDGQHGSYYTSYTDTAIANLVATAPATLDTLNELAAALGDDPNFATTVTNSIATKLNSSAYTAADVLTKIKTVDGAGSGLDADLLDGQQGSYYQPVSTALTTSTTFGGDVSGTYNSIVITDDSHNHIIANVDGLQTVLDGKLNSTNPAVTGTVVEDIYTLSGTSAVLTPSNGSIQVHTLTGATTYTTNFTAGQGITLMIDDGAGYTITWPAITWVNNAKIAPTLATTGYTVVALWSVGSVVYGAVVGNGT